MLSTVNIARARSSNSLHHATCRLILAAALVALAVASALADAIDTRITVGRNAGGWLVEYVFAEPVRAMVFGPSVMEYRADKWNILTEGLAIESVEGEDRLVGADVFTKVTVAVAPHDVFPPKNYVPSSAFSNGGSTLFLGFFHADLIAPDGETLEMNPKFELHGRDGEVAIMPSQVERGLRVFAYFGPQKPVETGHARLLIDPRTPPWLLDVITSLVPDVTKLYAGGLGFELPEKPLIMIGAGRIDSQDGYSVKGGALNGHIMITLRGKGLYEDSHRAMFEKLLAHEIAHLWQDGPGESPIGQKDPWVHEGGADALAVAALQRLGYWDDKQVASFKDRTVSQCDDQLGDRTLAEAVEGGDWGPVYSCGYKMFLQTQVDIFELWEALLKEATLKHEPLSQALVDRVVATGSE
jgi:hypothetical protein